MKTSDFVHLHCHSTYSLLEALPSPGEIVSRTKELGQSAVGLADKGHVYGLLEFQQEVEKAGIKPILGMDVWVAPRTRFDRENGPEAAGSPLTLFAETQEGYAHLLLLATAAALEGMHERPRVDRELLMKYGKGLLALSGPIAGAIPQAALAEDRKRITALTEEYRSYFGKENLYYELMDLPGVAGQAEVNQQLIAAADALDVPLVATCNSHYCRSDDAEVLDILLCIQKNALFDDPSRFSMQNSDYSMRPFEELERVFGHVPKALENTRAIAERCSVAFSFGKHLPLRFPVPKGETESSYLTKLCAEGFSARYPRATAEHRDRLEFELSVIRETGFAGYFLIVADFVNEAKRRGITVGPGRGSAAGSIVSYCLGITTIEPLSHGLLFERFLNPERITMPDFDIDFADNRRDEVLDYVRGKYDRDHVIQICTFGTLAARAAVKDVGRTFGVPFLEMNSLVKLIPDRPGTKLRDALETDELKAVYEQNENYRRIIDAALKLEGKARHVSIHACGVIITEKPAVTYTALQRAPKNENIIITQYSAKPLEALGLLKIDFLGLTNLTVIQTTLEIIERLHGKTIVLADLPLDDAETFRLLQRGDTTGVFQLESAGMRRNLKQLKPTVFGDITAMVALYRPGPMEWIPSYIKRKHGNEDVEYIHEDLEPILKPTYGIGVYQEQVLQIAQIFAGFSLGEADILRRAIGKKIKKELAAQREKFIAGAVKKKYGKALAERIFDDVITPFAGYGFNKSHATGYARIAYETAYLKAHYPTEFMAALLSSDAERTDRILIEIEECRAMGIAVLPPDINESLRHFTAVNVEKPKKGSVRPGSIRFGLSAIKGIGDSSVNEIIDARTAGGPFASLEDFVRRIPAKLLNKKLLEALAKSGALDSLAERRAILEHYERIIAYRKSVGEGGSAQGDLFGNGEGSVLTMTIDLPSTPPAGPLEKLTWERETLGLYVSSHPLAGLRKYVGKKAQLVRDLTAKDAGRKVTLAGLEESVKKITTKKGESMAILELQDPTGKIEVTLFPRIFAEAQKLLGQPDTVVVIGGTLDVRGGALQVRADAVKRASLTTMIARAKEEGFFDEEEAKAGVRSFVRSAPEEGVVELLDEEGNVIAGEMQRVGNGGNAEEEFYGPLGKWIMMGMKEENAVRVLGLGDAHDEHEGTVRTQKIDSSVSSEPVLSSVEGSSVSSESSSRTAISIHSIDLPREAPRALLLDLKRVLQTFPGKEKIQLKIGEQMIPLSLTVSMSTVLEKKIEEVIAKHSGKIARPA